MGIKGIYKELGPGKRVALSKLAADSFVNEDRPFRLAIDIAIWQFQTQAARGGTNPAIRTLFYRLVRLLGTPIDPIFVFDGPNKPTFKRNKRSGRGDGVATAQAKRLIRLFGFTVHNAPGEAEAECALLQRHGIVDAVLSEDVDTIMFGCTRTLRNWSAESKGSKTPTHVNMYDVEKLKLADLGLDREGMVLVALMSGGDYLPDGIPGCGVKVACEAAKAGFGKSICRLKAADKDAIQAWRKSLIHELRTNESGHFRTRHMSLTIPEDFPNIEVLRYYTHPVVSGASTLDAVREKFQEKGEMQLDALREFTRETFDWDYRIGALKFIKVLSEALLVQKIQEEEQNGRLIQQISKRRTHFSTDATSELRVSFVPEEVVPIDLSKEVDEEISSSRDGLALNSDEEFDAADGLETNEASRTAPIKLLDPSKPALAWVLEAVANKAIPAKVQEWETSLASKGPKKAPSKKKPVTSKGKKGSSMPTGALDQYVRITKAAAQSDRLRKPERAPSPTPESPKSPAKSPTKPRTPRRIRMPAPLEPSKQPTASTSGSPARHRNPWTIASSQVTPRTPKHLPGSTSDEAIIVLSSPAGPAESPPRSPTPRARSRRVPAGAEKPSSPVRQVLPETDIGKMMRDAMLGGRSPGRSAKAGGLLGSSQETRLKQTSLDFFTTKVNKSTSNKPDWSSPAKTTGQSTEDSRLQTSSQASNRSQPPTLKSPTRKEVPFMKQPEQAPFDISDSDSDSSPNTHPNLPQDPIPPLSPSKRHPPPPTPRTPSPSPAPKKKLLVPRASAVGFFREIEVDAQVREEALQRENERLQRRGCNARVTRWSDVAVVDLTGED